MLYQLTIENFFSIADAQTIRFDIGRGVPKQPSFRASAFQAETRLPTVIGFFGANASGKTTILRAILSACYFGTSSFERDLCSAWFQPYRHKAWWEKPTKISIEFDSQLDSTMTPTKFRYELEITHSPEDIFRKTVAREALFYSPNGKIRRLFERDGQTFVFGKDFGGFSQNDERVKSIREDASVISTLAKLNHAPSIHLSKLVATLQTNTWGFKKIHQKNTEWLSIYANDSDCLKRLNRELRRLDVGLQSMSVVEKTESSYFAKMKHVGLDGDIFLDEESAGTQRFIEIFPRLHYALELGSIALIDELDTDFHPLLLPELFRWFNDPKRNSRGAQLLFTAHNPVLLDDLQKEQIFFVEKRSGKSSEIFGARDIQGLRRDPSLMKKYLAGQLGAIPQIG